MQAWPRILVVFVLPAAAAAWCVYYQFDSEAAVKLTREGRQIQWMQVIFLAGATVFGLRVVSRLWRRDESLLMRTGFAVLIVLLVLLIMEETNWGQDVLGFATPAWVDSGQKERPFSVHNLTYFQPYRHWLLILFGMGGIAVVVLARVFSGRDIRKDLSFFSPPPYFLYTLALILFSGLFRELTLSGASPFDTTFSSYRFWAGRFTEIAEFGVAMIAFAYTGSKYHALAQPVVARPS